MLLKLLCGTLHVKYACALLLSILVALLIVSYEKYTLVPAWVLHMHSSFDHHDLRNGIGLWRRHHILAASIPFDWRMNFSISSFLAICSITDNGSLVIIYRVPLFLQVENLDRSARKRSLLQGISPVSHFDLPNELVVAVDLTYYGNGLVCAVVSTSLSHIGVVSTYSVFLFDAKARSIWNKSIPTPSLMTDDSLPSIHIDARCDVVSAQTCGVVFVSLPLRVDNDLLRSTMALSLKNGEVLWHFKPGELHVSVKPFSLSVIEKHWKLALLDQFKSHSHIGESAWEQYRESLVNVMPISWWGPDDGRIIPFHVAPSGIRGELDGNVGKTNALAIVHSQGLDVLHSTSGKLLTRLIHEWKPGTTVAIIPTLNESGYFYRSLGHNALNEVRLTSTIVPSRMNSYGVHIQYSDTATETDASSHGEFSHMIDCVGVIKILEADTDERSPSPRQSSIIHSGLCRPHSMLEFARLGKPEWLEDEEKMTPPLVVKRTSQSLDSSGFWSMWFPSLSPRRGRDLHTTTKRNDNGHDIIFLTSDGSLTSVSALGYENWRGNAEVSWLQVSRTMIADGDTMDHNLQHFYKRYFTPSLTAAQFVSMPSWLTDYEAIRQWKPERWSLNKPVLPVLISVGWDSLSFVSRYTGSLLANHKLPSHPTGKPIFLNLRISDASGRTTDSLFSSLVVVPCEGMLVAFGLVQQWRLLSFVLTLSCLFVSFIVLRFFCTTDIFTESV